MKDNESRRNERQLCRMRSIGAGKDGGLTFLSLVVKNPLGAFPCEDEACNFPRRRACAERISPGTCTWPWT